MEEEDEGRDQVSLTTFSMEEEDGEAIKLVNHLSPMDEVDEDQRSGF